MGPNHADTSGVFTRATYGALRGFRAAKLVSLLTWQIHAHRLTVPTASLSGSGVASLNIAACGYGVKDDRKAALFLIGST